MQLCKSVTWCVAFLPLCLPRSSGRLFGDLAVPSKALRDSQLQQLTYAGGHTNTVQTSSLVDNVRYHPLCSRAHAVLSHGALDSPNSPGTLLGLSIQGFDDETEQVAVSIHGVKQNEATSGLFAKDQCPDAELLGDNSWSIRLENGQMRTDTNSKMAHKGRTYYISFSAETRETACEGVVSICVPVIGSDSCTASQEDALFDSTMCPIFG